MRFTRRIDAINRLVIPKQGMEQLGWTTETPIDIEVRGQSMVLTAHVEEDAGPTGPSPAAE